MFKRKKPVEAAPRKIPTNLGIIMDGNGRWAKKRGLPRTAGHVTGAQVFRKITKYCEKCGVRYLTVYAFSTENWRRPQDEVESIASSVSERVAGGFSAGKYRGTLYW